MPLSRWNFGCPCCDEDTATATLTATPTATATPSVSTIGDCPDCPDGAPLCWELVVAGVTNAAGVDCCSPFNGTFILHWRGGCTWSTDEVGISVIDDTLPCGTCPSKMYVLERTGIGVSRRWSLQAFCNFTSPEGNAASYGQASDGLDCLGDNVLTGGGTAASCTGWPATLTISPTVCP